VELGGQGTEDPCHHDAVQSSPIDGRISDIREDMVVESVATKREKHEVTPPLVVGRRWFQDDRDHRSYILETGSLRMQVRGEGGVGVGAGVGGAVVVVILGNHYPLGSGELLFRVTGDGLLLFPSEGDGALTRPCLVQGLACGSHGGDESLLLSVRGSGGGLSRGRGVVLLPLGYGGGRDGDGGLLLIDGEVGGAARHDRQDGGGWRRTLGLGQRCAEAKKKSMALITKLEIGVPSKIR
jgi:hypothetical protein